MAFSLKRLIVEIHRRSLWQVVGIFLVGGWMAFEAVQTLTEGLGLPAWFPALALVLLIVLFPVVVATAFVQEGSGTSSPPQPLEPDLPPPPSDASPAPHHRHLTWRNALLGGFAGLLILGGSGVGYMGLRAAGVGPFGSLMARGDWAERDRIVLAEFEDRAGDSLVAYGATEWFRVALTQSEVVSLADGDFLAGIMRRMGLDAEATLDCETAREVAVREGLKAVVCGEVVSVGSGFVVSTRLLGAEKGESPWALSWPRRPCRPSPRPPSKPFDSSIEAGTIWPTETTPPAWAFSGKR